MLLKEKGARKDAEPVSMSWDEAQAAIAAGTHEPVNDEADEGGETSEAKAAQADKKPESGKPAAK